MKIVTALTLSLVVTGCSGPLDPSAPGEQLVTEVHDEQAAGLIVQGEYTETVTWSDCDGTVVGEEYRSLGVMVQSGDRLTLEFDTFPSLSGAAGFPAEVSGYAEWPVSPTGGMMRCTVGGTVEATDTALIGFISERLQADDGQGCQTAVEFRFVPETMP